MTGDLFAVVIQLFATDAHLEPARLQAIVDALNKIDAMTPAEANRKRSALARAIGKDVRLVSGVSGAGVRDLVNEIAAMLRERRSDQVKAEEAEQDWTP